MLAINFNPFPVLTTERLILRQLEITDYKAIFALRSDHSVNKYIDRPKSITIEEAKHFIKKINRGIAENEWIYWAVTLINDNQLIGTVCLWNISKEHAEAETGYELQPNFQGMGIMREVLSKIIDYGFQTMKIKTIKAYTHVDNLKSSKLLEKYNFKIAGESVNESGMKNIIYSLTNEEEE